MATHDYNIANQTGADFRADLNNALLAIVSNNSNATSPSTTYAYQLWVDTANNVLKLRNSANSDWITTGISITASNSFTGDITGNSATATALATARTINGVSFDGTANISFNTDSVSEGSSNLYFTNERVDDQVNSLLTAGSGISLTYDDAAGTLTIANTNSADITSVVAGDGLTGGGTSGDVTLAVSVDDSSIEINSDTLRVKASGITNAMLAGSIANSKLANSSVTINSQAISLGGSHTFDSDDIGEGSSNLYFTNARARGSLSIGSEGTASGNGAIAYNSSTGVFTYTPPVISGLSGDTDDLSEGSSNLYYTDARSNAAIDARVTNTFINNLSGVVADTATALATARSIALSGDVTASGVNFDGTGDITLSTTIAANSVALGTDTTGNYVATIADAGNSRITVANSGSETAAVTLDIADDAIGTDQLANNAVVLGTQSTGNYVATITGTTNEIEVSGSGSETASVTIGLPDNVTIAGNLTVNGTTTSVNTQTLEVEDPLIKLAKANSGADSVDIGFYGLYDTSGSQDLYAGLFRDASDSGKFKLFKDLQAEPTTTVNTSGTGYAVGTLVSNLEGDVIGNVTGNVSGTAATVTGAAQTNITSLGTLTGLTVSGDATFDTSTLKVDSSNNRVGIGTASPTFKLDLDTSSGSYQRITGSDQANVRLRFTNGGSGGKSYEIVGGLAGANNSAFSIFDVDNSATRLSIDSSGDVTIGGTLATTLSTAAQPNITSVGTLTTLTVDDITINGSTISDSGNLTVDVGGDIILDAGGDDITFKSGGTEFGSIFKNSNDLFLNSAISDGDIKFRGNDGGSFITALTLDMSEAGAATFNSGITAAGNITFGDGHSIGDDADDNLAIASSANENIIIDSSDDIILDAGGGDWKFKDDGVDIGLIANSSSDLIIQSIVSDKDMLFRGNDGGSTIVAMTLDMSNAGAATFNSTISSGDITISDATPTLTFTDTDNNYDATIAGLSGSLVLTADSGAEFGTETIQFHTGGSQRATIDSSGRFGIGTSSPAKPLHINSASNQLRIEDSTNGKKYDLNVDANNFMIDDMSAGVNRFTIDNSGLVGIGTASPSTKLDVVGNIASTGVATPEFELVPTGSVGNADLKFDGTTFDIRSNSSSAALTLQTASTERLRILSGGNIGINTSTPTYLFNVLASSGSQNIFQAGQSGVSNGLSIVSDGSELTYSFLTGKIGVGTASPTGKLNIVSGSSGSYLLNLDYNDNTDGGGFFQSGSVGLSLFLKNSSATQTVQVATEGVSYFNGGNFGIGTASPDDELDVEGADPAIRLTDTSASGYARMFANNGSLLLQADEGNSVNNSIIGFDVDGTERARIDSSGNLGLGTSNPTKLLHLKGSAAQIRIEDSDGTNQIADITSDSGDMFLTSRNNTSHGEIIFRRYNGTSVLETARIDDSGNFGLGTSSPSTKFDCQGSALINGDLALGAADSANRTLTIAGGASGNAEGGEIRLATAADHDSTYDFYRLDVNQDDFRIGRAGTTDITLDSSGNLGLGIDSPACKFNIVDASSPTVRIKDTTNNCELQLYAQNSDAHIGTSSNHNLIVDVNNTERARIDTSGNLIVGGTSVYAVDAVSLTSGGQLYASRTSANAIEVNRSGTDGESVRLQKNGTTVGTISVTGSATAYNTSSDARLKDITGLSRGLDVINNLNPVAYNWKADGKADEGLIAQEVEELVPNAVNQNEDGYYQMDYSKLVTHLVKAIQEQQEQIESLKSEIANLKGE